MSEYDDQEVSIGDNIDEEEEEEELDDDAEDLDMSDEVSEDDPYGYGDDTEEGKGIYSSSLYEALDPNNEMQERYTS